MLQIYCTITRNTKTEKTKTKKAAFKKQEIKSAKAIMIPIPRGREKTSANRFPS